MSGTRLNAIGLVIIGVAMIFLGLLLNASGLLVTIMVAGGAVVLLIGAIIVFRTPDTPEE